MIHEQTNIFQNKFPQKEHFDCNSSQDQVKREWTEPQNFRVYELHNQFGNKWALIAQRLQNRTDNCVKNHFYSRLRKSLRKINKTISTEFKRSFKQFKIVDLYKVIEASDQKFKEVKSQNTEFAQIGNDLKNRLFIYAQDQDDETQEHRLKVQKIIEDFTDFIKNYKRKSKKNRRYSPMGVDSVYRIQQKNSLNQPQFSQESIKDKSDIIILEPSQQIIHTTIEENSSKIMERRSMKTSQNSIQESKKMEKNEAGRRKNSDLSKPGQLKQSCKSVKHKPKTKNYGHFSDEQDDAQREAQFLKQQRLDSFAQNILKTFKSYCSYQSSHSNSLLHELFQ